MKKLLAFAFAFTIAAPAAQAASFTVTPASGSYRAGDLVTLSISVDPEGGAAYAAVLDARVSPETFSIVSFTPAEGILPLVQPGYDAIDAVTGALVKTGGYPGGTRSLAPFGTLVLRAVADGTGTVTVHDASQILDSTNTDRQQGSRTFSFSIAPAAPEPVPTRAEAAEPPAATSMATGTAAVQNTASSTLAVIAAQVAAAAGAAGSNPLASAASALLIGIFLGALLFAVTREKPGAPQPPKEKN